MLGAGFVPKNYNSAVVDVLLEQQELRFYQAKMQRKYTQIAQQQFLELKKA